MSSEQQIEVAKRVIDAMELIESGVCKRADINDRVKVYLVKDVIRIDVKR